VEVSGRVLIDRRWPRSKARALVKLLALQPARSLHRDQVIEALWPHLDAEAGENQLHKNIHYLRQALHEHGGAPLVRLEGPLVLLDNHAQIDAACFAEKARTALGPPASPPDAAPLEEALALYAGALLPEDQYEPWCDRPRAELADLAQRLRLAAAAARERHGDFEGAAQHYERVVADDRAREEAHRGLMRAYAALGQRDRALRQYDACAAALVDEVGALPSRETAQLAARIRRAHTARDLDQIPPPEIRHVTTNDGTRIASHVIGAGRPLVVVPNIPWNDIEREWHMREYRDWFLKLSRGRTLVRFDLPIQGRSDRRPERASVDTWVSDIDALASGLGLPQFDLLSGISSGAVAVAYAATHPDRVRRLVLWEPWVRGVDLVWAEPMKLAQPANDGPWDELCRWASHTTLGWRHPEVAEAMSEVIRGSSSTEIVASLWGWYTNVDLMPALARLTMPALVLHGSEATLVHEETLRHIASQLPNGQFRIIPGAEQLPIVGDVDAIVRAIHDFLDMPEPHADRDAPAGSLNRAGITHV